MKKTKDNWIKAFDEITVTYTDTGNHSWQEPLNLEPEEYYILTNFISKVENDAENRGYTKGLKAKEAQRVVDALGSEQGKELVDNLVQDAIEKTNKRWESELYRIANEWDDELSELQGLPPHQHNPKMWSIITNILSRMKSDLLEDKK